jgi:DNA-binding NarL/FixJ family response regulator
MADAAVITVALVEDDAGTHERISRAIASDPGLRLVYKDERAADAIARLDGEPIDVLLVDLGLPDRSGTEVIAACRVQQPTCEVMVLTMFGDEANMLRAFEAGARGYLLKDGTEADLAQHVRTLHAGGSPMSPIIARQLLHRWRATQPHPASAAPDIAATDAALTLSGREHEILDLVSRGFPYPEVASRLAIKVNTVRAHVRNIYAKLDVHNKTEAVFEARQLGLLR